MLSYATLYQNHSPANIILLSPVASSYNSLLALEILEMLEPPDIAALITVSLTLSTITVVDGLSVIDLTTPLTLSSP